MSIITVRKTFDTLLPYAQLWDTYGVPVDLIKIRTGLAVSVDLFKQILKIHRLELEVIRKLKAKA